MYVPMSVIRRLVRVSAALVIGMIRVKIYDTGNYYATK